jgi:drug/metabolite transporter (DMT)-like permease
VGSLAFLAVFGSILAFGAYLTLVGRIGAGRAGYAMVAIPVVALALSTLMEGLRWHGWLVVGVALCLLGNLLVLPRAPRVVEGAA